MICIAFADFSDQLLACFAHVDISSHSSQHLCRQTELGCLCVLRTHRSCKTRENHHGCQSGEPFQLNKMSRRKSHSANSLIALFSVVCVHVVLAQTPSGLSEWCAQPSQGWYGNHTSSLACKTNTTCQVYQGGSSVTGSSNGLEGVSRC